MQFRSGLCTISLAVLSCTGTVGSTNAVDDNGGPGGFAGGSPDGGIADDQPTVCDPREVGFAPLRSLSAHEYVNTLREVFRGAQIPSGAFPTAGNRGALDLSARTLEQVDRDGRTLLAAAFKDVKGWLGCDLAPDVDGSCHTKLVAELGQRVFRRPLTGVEADDFLKLFRSLQSEDGFAPGEAGSVVVRAMLQAPEFLYHLELRPPGAPDAPAFALTDHALASRLSYFLWQSMPDPELMAAASQGRLRDDKGLEVQVKRMLADPRAMESLADWFERWLGTSDKQDLSKNAEAYPNFNAELRDEMRAETRRFFRSVMEDHDGSLKTLLTADYTIATPAVAALYGVEHPGQGPQKISLPPGQRAGVLTQPWVLAVHGATFGSHPVKRGLLVRTHLLCQTVPPPPPDVDTSISPDSHAPGASTREVFTVHTKSAACASCHKLIDPLGFAFEHYDGIGRYREKDGMHPVDASGELSGTDVDGTFVGAVQLAQRLANSEQVATCAATKMFELAHGRLAVAQDECRIQALGTWFAKGPRSLSDLVIKVLAEPSLRYRLYDQKP